MDTYFILNDDGEAIEEPDERRFIDALDALLHENKHILRQTEIPVGDEGIQISTIFRGHGPCPFETMIFGSASDGYEVRSRTRAEAEATHAALVQQMAQLRSDDAHEEADSEEHR